MTTSSGNDDDRRNRTNSNPIGSTSSGRRSPNETRDLRKLTMRFAGLGTELASYTLAMAGAGYLIDHYRGHTKAYATAFGALVGFSYGMYRFVSQVRQQANGPRR